MSKHNMKSRVKTSGPDLVGKAPIAPGSTPPSRGKGLALPHERDESASSMASEPDPKIVQAKRDLDAGMVDTDMHATPGLDADLRKKMVPGPGGEINATSRAETD
jgi:hypothetical protein